MLIFWSERSGNAVKKARVVSLWLHEKSSFSNLSVTSPTSRLILQPFRRFTYVTAHYPTCLRFTYVTAYSHYPNLPSLHLLHSSCSNSSVASPKSQLILNLQSFCRFTYITAHSPTLPLLHLHHSSFTNPSVASPTSQLILQSFCRFTYITAHSPTLPLLHLRHSSFVNPSRFSYITGSSLTSPGDPPMI